MATLLLFAMSGVSACKTRSDGALLLSQESGTAASIPYVSLNCTPSGSLNVLAPGVSSVSESQSAHRLGSGPYVLQYFSQGQLAQSSDAALLRLVPNAEFGSFSNAAGRCRFDKKTAMIFVYGVGNTDKGTSREQIPWELLDSLMVWNQATTYPRDPESPSNNRDPEGDGHGKLTSWPGYLQIVENTNPGPTERGGGAGMAGYHSVRAMRSFAKAVRLAFASGVEHLEIVTHSNGAITSHVGFNYFADEYMGTKAKRDTILAERQRATSTPMTIKFYHLQAAARSIRRVYQGGPTPPGYYTDFVRLTRNTSNWQTAHQAWSDATNRDLNAYLGNSNLRPHFNWRFRHYYNDGDTWTYGTSGTAVGFYVSKYWYRIVQEVSAPQSKLFARHYACTGTWRNRCGPSHDNGHSALREFVAASGPGNRFGLRF